MLIEDYNLTTDDKNLETFLNTLNLEFLINKSACVQPENQSCIDLILTKKELFNHLEVIQVGISSHHSFIVTSLKSQLVRGNTKSKIYWGWSTFRMEAFKDLIEVWVPETYTNTCTFKIHLSILLISTGRLRNKYLGSTIIVHDKGTEKGNYV